MYGLVNGRTVHYVMSPDDYNERGVYHGANAAHHRPAIVTENFGHDESEDEAPAVNLYIIPDGMNDGHAQPFFKMSVVFSEDKEPGTWHWPEISPAPKVQPVVTDQSVASPAASATVIVTPPGPPVAAEPTAIVAEQKADEQV